MNISQPSEIEANSFAPPPSPDQKPGIYSPLDGYKAEIRVVTLAPGTTGDPIECNLSVMRRQDSVQYEALSYVWGDPAVTSDISLNGFSQGITNNLYEALQSIRLRNASRVLRIDALCINQMDKEERSSQVTQMGLIFKDASQVISWLGPAEPDTDMAFDLLDTMAQFSGNDHWNVQDQPKLKPVYTTEHLQAVSRLVRRSWWTRMWRVQEAVMCPLMIYKCGQRETRALEVLKAHFSLCRHAISCCNDIDHTDLIRATTRFSFVDNSTAISEDALHAFAFYQHRQCSDPRDKIYALLGLLRPGDAAAFSPDYNMPFEDICELAAVKLIMLSGTLDVFSQRIQPSAVGLGDLTQLPHWVPVWMYDPTGTIRRTVSDTLYRRVRNLEQYDASKKSRANVRRPRKGILTLRGRTVSRIILLDSQAGPRVPSGNANWFLKWHKFVEHPNTDTTWSAAMFNKRWPLLCAGTLPVLDEGDEHPHYKSIKDNPQDRDAFQAAWSWLKLHHVDGKPHDQERAVMAEESCAHFQAFTAMRFPFMAASAVGNTGLAPDHARIDDHIVLLEGGKTPYILRPQELFRNEDGKVYKAYNFIGDAYVHGIMDGEAWNEDDLEDIALF